MKSSHGHLCCQGGIFLLTVIYCFTISSNAAVWVSGSNTTDQAGVYGTKGVPSPSNVPGARDRSVSWTDTDGNLWLFGGYYFSYSEYGTIITKIFNDLWKFDCSTDQWIWVSGSNTSGEFGVYGTKGVPASSNIPGARHGSTSWIDGSGNLWLLGGWGMPTYSFPPVSGNLNDLWKYNPSTGLWIWMSGSNQTNQTGVYGTKGVPNVSNIPGGRTYSSQA